MMSAQAGNIGVLMELHDENQGIQPRWRFIIGTVGIAQAMGMLTHLVWRQSTETVCEIQAFPHMHVTKGAQAAPAGLMPGEQTLKPRLALQGNAGKLRPPKMGYRVG
jgi:alkyl hydroperoxide reductase subunit AhpC